MHPAFAPVPEQSQSRVPCGADFSSLTNLVKLEEELVS